MDKAEATGFGVAVAGHGALLAALSLGLANAQLPPITNQPIEVSFVDETGLESEAPVVSNEIPAPALGEVEGPPEPLPPPPEPVAQPQPQPAPQPRPAAAAPTPAPAPPKPQPQPKQKAAPAPPKAKAAPPKQTQRTGNLKGILSGIGDQASNSKATTPPAAKAGPAVQASLRSAVRRQLKPHWKAPTGADAENLRTELEITLAKSGAVTGIRVLRTTGITASNRPQVALHQEQAKRAVRLASPFELPDEYYDVWKILSPIGFDKRLSQ